MKKLALTLVMCLMAWLGVQAQTIMENDKFWDGVMLYTASVEQGNVALKGFDIQGNTRELNLKKEKGNGEYTLQPAEGEAPYGCLWGSRVKYIRHDGMNFLAFYPEEHTIGQVAVLTVDHIANCYNQQKTMEEEYDPMKLMSICLLNQKYLSGLHPELLQRMVNELQKVKKQNVIEETNQQLIAYALAVGTYGKDAESCTPAAGDLQIYQVSNEREFLEALGTNRVIRLADGTHLNLSTILEDSAAAIVAGLEWKDDYYDERSGNAELRVSCSRFDGRQLDLVNMHNLTIRGGEDCSIVVRPRYANVLNFYNCSNVKVENLTLGHTVEEGYCEGGVLFMEGCKSMIVTNCDLYGCGTYGIETWKTSGVVMQNTVIHDCSYGIMQLIDTEYCSFLNCDFIRCREFGLIDINENCRIVRFRDCRFTQNQGLLFANRAAIMLENCEIHHSGRTQNEFTAEIKNLDKNTRWYSDNDNLSPRAIGPSSGK